MNNEPVQQTSPYTMNARGDYISPVRAKSKLKKRRRQRESSVSTCSFQKVSSSAVEVVAAASDVIKKNRSNDNVTHASNEPTIVDRDGIHYSSSLQKENNNDCSVKPSPRTNRNKSKGLTDPSLSQNNNYGTSEQTNNNIGGTSAKSKLACIDDMDLTELSRFENDIMSSFTDVDITSELKRAFVSSNKDSIGNTDDYNPFHHDVNGRIGLPKGNDRTFSIAFPRSSATNISETGAEEHNIPTSLQNMKTSTCHAGMNIPLSWCQFPGPQAEQTTSRRDDGALIRIDQNDNAQEEMVIETEQEVATSSLHKCQGKVMITSVKGATIREVFDIDESDHVIGKLHQGDERCFVEKRLLPAPPPDSDDDFDDDESDDEECVDVLRYKIVLDTHDCIGCSHDVIDKDRSSGKMFGWISDRGRLASDPYFILKEIDNMNSE